MHGDESRLYDAEWRKLKKGHYNLKCRRTTDLMVRMTE
jgi:hypothetical protein